MPTKHLPESPLLAHIELDANQKKWCSLLRQQLRSIDAEFGRQNKSLSAAARKAQVLGTCWSIGDFKSTLLLAKAAGLSEFAIRHYLELASWPSDLLIYFNSPHAFALSIVEVVKKLKITYGVERVTDTAVRILPYSHALKSHAIRLSLLESALYSKQQDALSQSMLLFRSPEFILTFDGENNVIKITFSNSLNAEIIAEEAKSFAEKIEQKIRLTK